MLRQAGILGRDLQPPLDVLNARPQIVEVEAGVVAALVVPLRQHMLGRREADSVVDDRAAADAAPLQHGELKVAGLLKQAVGVEAAHHLHLIRAERRRWHVLAALEDDDLVARFRQVVGDDGAGGAAADDADVGLVAAFVVALRRLHVQREGALPGRNDVRPLHLELRKVGPLLEADVAHRGVGPPVVVVADVGELFGDADHHLHEVAPPVRNEPQGDVALKVRLQMAQSLVMIQLRERSLQIEDGVQLQQEDDHALQPFADRPDVLERVVGGARDVARRHRLVRTEHDHVGQGDQRSIPGRPQILRAEARIETPAS